MLTTDIVLCIRIMCSNIVRTMDLRGINSEASTFLYTRKFANQQESVNSFKLVNVYTQVYRGGVYTADVFT